MGPIEGSVFTEQQLKTLLSNEQVIDTLTHLLGWGGKGPEGLAGFTSSGKDFNPTTSRAVLRSTTGSYLGPAEGRTPAELTKDVIRHRNENAILRAAQELARPIESLPTPSAPSVPTTPGRPPVGPSVLGAVARNMNPIMAFLELMLHSGELNSNEKEQLKKRDMEEAAAWQAEVDKRAMEAQRKKIQQNIQQAIPLLPARPNTPYRGSY